MLVGRAPHQIQCVAPQQNAFPLDRLRLEQNVHRGDALLWAVGGVTLYILFSPSKESRARVRSWWTATRVSARIFLVGLVLILAGTALGFIRSTPDHYEYLALLTVTLVLELWARYSRPAV